MIKYLWQYVGCRYGNLHIAGVVLVKNDELIIHSIDANVCIAVDNCQDVRIYSNEDMLKLTFRQLLYSRNVIHKNVREFLGERGLC